MKRSNIFLLIVLVLVVSSCFFGRKKKKSSDCVGCPEPVTMVVPDLLVNNSEATLYIKDAETMFNKWSKKAHILAGDLEELEKMDTANMSFSESMKASKTALRMITYMGEFMSEGVVMANRREQIMVNMSDEEKEAFDEVWEQLDEQLNDISKTFEALNASNTVNEDLNIDDSDLMEEEESSEVEEESVTM